MLNYRIFSELNFCVQNRASSYKNKINYCNLLQFSAIVIHCTCSFIHSENEEWVIIQAFNEISHECENEQGYLYSTSNNVSIIYISYLFPFSKV